MKKISEEELNDDQIDEMAELVLDRFDRAKSARNTPFYQDKPIENWLDEAYDRYRAVHSKDGFDLVRIKTASLHAKVKDMVINAVDAPFTLSPTPNPDLSKSQTESVQFNVEKALADRLYEEGIVIQDPATGEMIPNFNAVLDDNIRIIPEARDWLREEAKKQKKSQQFEQSLIAKKACNGAVEAMKDQLSEGGWRDAILECDFDIFLYGTGCLRQEIKEVKSLKWSGDELKECTEERITWRHVPIRNCYPSADSESANDGTFFIERAAMRKQDLWACTQIDWIDKDRLKDAYENATKNADWLQDNPEQDTAWHDDDMIDVLIHEGTVQGRVLSEYISDKEFDEDGFYDVEAIVVANVCIGARLIEHPHGNRSYFSASYMSAGMNFWGFGTAMLLAKTEDRLNKYLADLDDNTDLATSSPIFYNAARFENPDDIKLEKRKLIAFEPDTTGQDNSPPYYQTQFNSHSQELINLFNFFYRLSDDESGIPGLLSGNSQLFGGEDTFRGMKMLAASANTLIKSAFLNIDKTIIRPAMENLWRWNMLNNKNENIKADAKIIARGASGLMQQEIANAERMDALPVIAQLIGSAGLDEKTQKGILQYLLHETMNAGGIPADELMGNVNNSELGQVVGQVNQASLQPATPQPTIGADQNTGGLM